jgi:short-subunit dehydrogenase
MKKSKGSAHKFFSGKRVLITGGSSGIGKALAFKLLEADAEVSIVGKTRNAVESAALEFNRAGFQVVPWACDLADEEATLQLVNDVLAQTGAPDILINNAGFATYRTFEQLPLDEISALIGVNLLAPIRLTRGFIPAFIARRSGIIVNISSIAGRIPLTPNMVYTTAKHGLVAWSQCLRFELECFNIRINIICPGRVVTSFFDHETFRAREEPREARHTIPLPYVVDQTLDAIVRNRFITYIPKSFGLWVWAMNAFPFLMTPVYQRMMRRRLRTIDRMPPT